jgi:hypothetical protein
MYGKSFAVAVAAFVSLNLLESSGPVQACKGISLPFNCFDSVGKYCRPSASSGPGTRRRRLCVRAISVRKDFQRLCFVCGMSSFCSRSCVPRLFLSVNEVIGLCRSGPVPFTLLCTLSFKAAFHLDCGFD